MFFRKRNRLKKEGAVEPEDNKLVHEKNGEKMRTSIWLARYGRVIADGMLRDSTLFLNKEHQKKEDDITSSSTKL